MNTNYGIDFTKKMTPGQALRAAADQIEARPDLFKFSNISIPKTKPECGTAGCALGWISAFMGYVARPARGGDNGAYYDACIGDLGFRSPGRFYEKLNTLVRKGLGGEDHEWRSNIRLAAYGLRALADELEPAPKEPLRKIPTLQEVFNKVATHLLTQGKKALSDDDGTCQYRGANHTSCAVGCLIPDSQYKRAMEGNSIHSLFGQFKKEMAEANLDPELHCNMLTGLQSLHDYDDVDDWRESLRDLAKEYQLNENVLDGRFV